MAGDHKIRRADLAAAVARRTVFRCSLGHLWDVTKVGCIPGTDRPLLVVVRRHDQAKKVITWWHAVADVEKADRFMDLNHPDARVEIL